MTDDERLLRHGRPRPRHRRDVLLDLGRRGLRAGQGRLVRAGRRARAPRGRPRARRRRCSTSARSSTARLAARRRARRADHRAPARDAGADASPTTARGTTSCGASCGCSRSTTAPTTRSPRSSPRSPSRSSRSARQADRGRRLDAAIGPRAATASTWSTTCPACAGATMARLLELLERGRRVLPRAAAAHPRADTPQQLALRRRGTSASSSGRAAARSRSPGPAATPSKSPPSVRTAHPLPRPRCSAVVAVGGAVGALPALRPDRRLPRPDRRLPVDHLRDQRGRLLPAGAAARRSPSSVGTRCCPRCSAPACCGGFTTLSTYAEQTRALARRPTTASAAAYVVGTLAACLLAAVVAATGSTTPAPARPVRGRGGRPVTLAARRPRARPSGRRLRYLAGHLLDGRLPAGHDPGQLGRLVPARRVQRPRPDRATTLALLGTGFCGGLTTYSSFAVQAHDRGPRLGARGRSPGDRSYPPLAAVRCWLGLWLGASVGLVTAARRSRGRAAGRRRCRSGGRSRARR